MVRLLFELKICLNSFALDLFSVNDILEDGVVEGLRYIILKSEFSLNGYIERPVNLPEEG